MCVKPKPMKPQCCAIHPYTSFNCSFEVPDVEATCKRFEQLGVQFVKKPNDGRMKGLAFIKVS